MACRLMDLAICRTSSNYLAMKRCVSSFRYIGTSKKGLTQEIKIPIVYGHIAGKTWGISTNDPILCLHGWLDNCNTFDSLIPLLPADKFYVAIDFPGHGLSSHVPEGSWYHRPEYFACLKRVINYFGWEKITLMGHSMGGNIAGYFSALYPEIITKCIWLDAPGVYVNHKASLGGSRVRESVDGHLLQESKNHPPVKKYTYEEARNRLHNSSLNFKLTEKAGDILLERGLKEEGKGVFTFRRDFRHLLREPTITSIDIAKEVMKNIKCEVLVVRASKGILMGRFQENIERLWQYARPNLENLTIVNVEGYHHVHLNNPALVANHISKFLSNTTKSKL